MTGLTDDRVILQFRIALVIALMGVVVWVLVRPDPTPQPVPLSRYAGCYRSGATQVELTTAGQFVAAGRQWPYRIVPADEGKHGDLIKVGNIRMLALNDRIAFEPWPDPATFEVTAKNSLSTTLKQSDGTATDVELVPAPCKPVTP